MNFTRLPDLCLTEQQVNPVQGKKENKAGLLSWRVLASLFIAVLFLQVNSTQAQWMPASAGETIEGKDVVAPCKNCVAEDVKAVDFWFQGYEDRTKCLDSTDLIISDTLVVKLNVTAKDRYGLLFVANLHVDSGNGEKFLGTIYYCFQQTYRQGYAYDKVALNDPKIGINLRALKLKAGFKITLHDVFVAWDNNKPNGPKGKYLVCDGLYGTKVQGNKDTWLFDCTMIDGSGGAKAGVSLTPRCKKYSDVFLIKTPVRPIIHLKELKDESCFEGSGDGSISVFANPLWQIYTYGYVFNWLDADNELIKSTQDDTNESTIDGLSAGDYRVAAIVNVEGTTCTDTADFTVGIAPEILDSLSKKNEICDGENGYAFVAEVSGGTPFDVEEEGTAYKYYWSHSALIGDTINLDDPTADTLFGLAAGTYYVSIRDANGCEKIDSIKLKNDACPISDVFCTYTQGYFGTDNPGKATYDNGDGCQKTETRGTILASLSWWNERETKGDSLKIGNINLSSYATDEAAMLAILNYLPGGGPSYQWTESGFPPTDDEKHKNTLISQTLTLGLNIGLNKGFADFVLPDSLVLRHTGSCDGEGDDDDEYSSITHVVHIDEDFVGKTPLEIFNEASAALLENSGTNSNRTKYAGIAGFLNETFDECAAIIDLSEVPGSMARKSASVQTSGASNFEVKAYPNPFTNIVNFSFKAPVAGEVTVEIFDMTGRRLEIIRKTNTFAGQQNLIQFRANQNTAGQLLYKVSVGNYSVLGKLVNAKN